MINKIDICSAPSISICQHDIKTLAPCIVCDYEVCILCVDKHLITYTANSPDKLSKNSIELTKFTSHKISMN